MNLKIIQNNDNTSKVFIERRRHPIIRAIVDSSITGITIVVLIIISVLIILIETFCNISHNTKLFLEYINDVITIIFIIELYLRWLVSSSTKFFFKNYWLDILAILPLLRVFRLSRIFRLVRLLRLISLGTLIHNRLRFISWILEGRTIDLVILFFFTMFAIVFGAIGLAQFEVGHDPTLPNTTEAFWKALFSLLVGEYAEYPKTLGGKIVFIIISCLGMGIFAMITGTISALVIEKMRESTMKKPISFEELRDHIVICGFSPKITSMLEELLQEPAYNSCDILIVSEIADVNLLRTKNINLDRVYILNEDFTKLDTLKKAGIERARFAVILSESGNNRSTQDIDARTLLCALSIEKLKPGIHTSAELYNPEFVDHLKLAGVEDIVIQGEISGKFLAKVAAHEGLLPFFKELLSRSEGNSLIFKNVDSKFIGENFTNILHYYHKEKKCIPVAVKRADGKLLVNPINHILTESDLLLVIGHPERNE